MGMFDYIKCECPLPDRFDPSTHDWQTKDLDSTMDTYTITKDGKLKGGGNEHRTEFFENYHGDLRFYGSNSGGHGFEYCFSHDDSPLWWREYVARFTNGTLEKITGGINNKCYENSIQVPKANFHKLCEAKRLERQAQCKHPMDKRNSDSSYE